MKFQNQNLNGLLKKYWGFDSFRPRQKEIIQGILDEQDAIVLFPTGGGKSLCYQLPALCLSGLTIVISPLISLMKDQVQQLKKRGIPAASLNSANSKSENESILSNVRLSKYKLLYFSPERLNQEHFVRFLRDMDISLVVIDESHCVSIWGHDFRPSYLRIADFLVDIKSPRIALTATANKRTLEDIQKYLHLDKANLFRTSFVRSNLRFGIRRTDAKMQVLTDLIKKVNSSTIVYARSRLATVEISKELNQHGISAISYHAGMTNTQREKNQRHWTENRISTIVATSAFGMGIDKSNVRLVVHISPPPSIEDYYQEAGRAGRDGKQAYALLLYNEHDLSRLQKQVGTSFPSKNKIENFYITLFNFLKIPVEEGFMQVVPFNLENFIEETSFSKVDTYHLLKALERLKLISIKDRYLLTSRVQIRYDRRTLFDLYQEQDDISELLQEMLRKFEGLFSNLVSIDERILSKSLGISQEVIRKKLQKLAADNVIDLQLSSNESAVMILEPRIKSSALNLNIEVLEKLKAIAQEKLNAIFEYISKASCRQKLLLLYLDEKMSKDCGICDVCRLQATKKNPKEVKEIILSSLKENGSSMEELFLRLGQIPKKQITDALQDLLDEERLELMQGKLVVK